MVSAVEKNSGGTTILQATYTYDALDRRIGVDETIGGTETKTWTVYDGKNPYADFNGSGTLKQRYLYGPAVDEILARTDSGGTTAYYLADKLGTVRDIVAGWGASITVLDHIAYDSFGKVTNQTNATNGDRFQFAGMQTDPGTGLYYDKARWYSPVIGRFISQDPIGFWGGDGNLYRYVGDIPTTLTDPTGLFPEPHEKSMRGTPRPASPPDDPPVSNPPGGNSGGVIPTNPDGSPKDPGQQYEEIDKRQRDLGSPSE